MFPQLEDDACGKTLREHKNVIRNRTQGPRVHARFITKDNIDVLKFNFRVRKNVKKILSNGKELIIRKAILEDGVKMAHYKSGIGGESDFFTFGENEVDRFPEKEQQSIEAVNNKSNSLIAAALLDEEIVGSIVFKGGERIKTYHLGEMGIGIRRDFWGLGIGTFLLEYLIQWAKETGIVRKINLRVRTDNERALKLYRNHGFKEEGILTRDFCIDGRFYDSISMGLLID